MGKYQSPTVLQHASDYSAGQDVAVMSVKTIRDLRSMPPSASATESYRCARPIRGWTNTAIALRHMISWQWKRPPYGR